MNHNLHQAQSHELLRAWQSQRNDINHPIDFVLPLFICNDDDSIETISSMPGVFRYGCNKAISYLEPLVNKYGLRSILLFPVPNKSDIFEVKEFISVNRALRVDNYPDLGSSTDTSCTSQLTSPSLSNSSDTTNGEQSSSGKTPADQLGLVTMKDKKSNNQNPFISRDSEENRPLVPNDQVENSDVPLIGGDGIRKHMISSNPTSIKLLEIELIQTVAFREKYNPVLRLLPMLKARFPGLLIMCDVCLCAFTSTGHCCVFDDHSHDDSNSLRYASSLNPMDRYSMSNKLTCLYLAQLAVEYASRGCDVIAPSDMMDKRIHAIRKRLDAEKFDNTTIMSYSAKFASAFYGPFRQATNNVPEFGDRRDYQLPPGSRTLALRAVNRDLEEGADFIMVKPGGAYLDVIRDIRENHPEVPIAVYQVSGEYSMLKLAAKEGIIDYKKAVNETLTSFRRAGASIMITYFTPEFLKGEL